MKRLLKNFCYGFLTVALVLSLGNFARAAGEKVIKLGCAISLTGGESRSGKLYRDAYDMAVEQINKNGGVKAGNDIYQLELVYFDVKSDPAESSKLVEKLIAEDKVDFLLGPYSSGITIPDGIVAQRYKVPMIEGGGASDKIFSRGNKYIFGTLPPAGQYFKSTLEMLKIFNPAPQTFPWETGLQFRQSVCSLSCWSLSSAWCFFTF